MGMDENLCEPSIASTRNIILNKNDWLVTVRLRQNGFGVPDDV